MSAKAAAELQINEPVDSYELDMRSQTIHRVDPVKRSIFEVSDEKQTALSQIKVDRVLASSAPQAAPTTLTAAVASGRRELDAIIGEVTAEYVIVECHTPSGTVELQLPPAVIPADLLHYGQPVSISLDYSSGYRRPNIRRREVSQLPQLPGQEEVETWVRSL
ncbi:hypothetical protein [Bradyrhizobium sp.]|uniref:hypothetical protein n=1 Tax=Bradyrhizobium sp. TaxID=376 RepID=UPI0026225B9D|nr:hypothetical protein [Bradyrhizobium sp.]